MPFIEEDLKLCEEAKAKGQAYEFQFEKNLQNKRPEDQGFYEVEHQGARTFGCPALDAYSEHVRPEQVRRMCTHLIAG